MLMKGLEFRIVAFLYVLLLTVSCGSGVDDLLAGASGPSTKGLMTELRKYGLKTLKNALEDRIADTGRLRIKRSGKYEVGLLMEALLGLPGGRPVVLEAGLAMKQKGMLSGEIWRAFSLVAVHHRSWLFALLTGRGEPAWAGLKPDLLAAAAVEGGRKGLALFAGLLADYRLQPSLYQRAFELLPLKEFQRFADMSVPALRGLGVRRLRHRYDARKKMLPELKRLAAAGYPVLTVFLADELMRPVIRKYRSGTAYRASRAKIRRHVMHVYWFLTELRKTFKDRTEDEQRAYAAIVKIAYDVQSGQ